MSEQTKEIGVIGQKYEDRKTGKSGVLVSRDLKCKTLMLEADDGKTFLIANATFRSGWRKSKDSEVVEVDEASVAKESVETVEEVDDIITEDEFQHKSLEKKAMKKSGKTLDLTNLAMMSIFGTFADIVKVHLQKEDLHLTVKLRTKFGGVIVKDGRKNAFELWVKPERDAVEICMTKELYDAINWTVEKTVLADVHSSFGARSHVVTFNGISSASRVINILRDIITGLTIIQPNIKNKKDEVTE